MTIVATVEHNPFKMGQCWTLLLNGKVSSHYTNRDKALLIASDINHLQIKGTAHANS